MTTPTRHSFPTKVFLIGVGLVCLGLALTAWFSYRTSSRLRTDYLRNRGQATGTAIDGQMRGPMRRNTEFWQNTMQDTLQANGDSLAFIALLSQSNNLIAAAGRSADPAYPAAPGYTTLEGAGVYVIEMPLTSQRQGGMMGMGFSAPGRLRIGIYTASADFISRQAGLQMIAVSVAIAVLIILALVFLRTLRRFLELEAREESERQLRSLGTMAATLAHEIRNPLGAIKGLTQLAQENLPAEHDGQSLMKTVVKEAERLERLVTDLLTFARPFRPQYSALDFAQLLSDIKSILQPQLEAAGISLEVETGGGKIPVESDESGLRRVLLNTIMNAMDVTSKGGSVIVRAGQNPGSCELKVEIDDAGPGFGDRDPEQLFQPFTTTKTQGTGLGLAVSRQIVDKLGGTLRLSNRREGGARCTIILPGKMGKNGDVAENHDD